MISVAVKVETECGTCRMPMPVNTLAREVGCQSCGRPSVIEGELWQALFRDPVYEAPRMLQHEGRRRLAGKLSIAFTRRGPCCQGCEKEIPIASILEVRDRATLRCDSCATQTWVRAVPMEFAAALPNITHLVGEDPDPLAVSSTNAPEASTFPCPQCGSPVAFDGVRRAYTCRFCSASVHVPDDFVYRGRRKLAADWFLCFDTSVVDSAPAAQAVAAGLFDWIEPPVAAVDSEGNLYCAARQVHWYYNANGDVENRDDNVLWSVDPSLNVRWIWRDRLDAARFIGCVGDRLVLNGAESPSPSWLSSKTGTLVGAPGGAAAIKNLGLSDHSALACDRDGSLLIHKGGRLLRIASDGAEIAVWPGSDSPRDTDEYPLWDWDEPTDRPVRIRGSVDMLYCGSDGSVYMLSELWPDVLVRLDADGRTIYRVELPDQAPDGEHNLLGADLRGNAYVLRARRLVRVGATGAQSTVLQTERDSLPRPKMSLAVCPDGSFWLLGEEGLAWKFDAGGRLLFASEKEPRPRRPTQRDLIERKANALAEAFEEQAKQASAAAAEYSRMAKAQVEAIVDEKRRIERIGCVFSILLSVALFLFLLWLLR